MATSQWSSPPPSFEQQLLGLDSAINRNLVSCREGMAYHYCASRQPIYARPIDARLLTLPVALRAVLPPPVPMLPTDAPGLAPGFVPGSWRFDPIPLGGGPGFLSVCLRPVCGTGHEQLSICLLRKDPSSERKQPRVNPTLGAAAAFPVVAAGVIVVLASLKRKRDVALYRGDRAPRHGPSLPLWRGL
jgi:hypothetical protein